MDYLFTTIKIGLQGGKTSELNEQGISEAEQAVDLLENINFDIAFTSKLKEQTIL